MVNTGFITLSQCSLGYSKGSREQPVLTNISLSLNRGELVGVAGMNGVGKSTLLKTISGLIPLLAGKIEMDGKELSALTAEDLARLVSVVLTERLGGFNLKVYDLVAMGQMPFTDAFHRIKEEHRKVIESAMDRTGVSGFSQREVSELSDGMFQKAVIAKALAQQTPALLLDEPSAYLDYASKHHLFGLLKDLCVQNNKCVLVSSHDLDLLLKYCHKLLLVTSSGIELIPVSEALANRNFKQLGGGFI